MQSQPASKCIYNDFNQCRTILERNIASLVTVERTSAFEEETNLFMNIRARRPTLDGEKITRSSVALYNWRVADMVDGDDGDGAAPTAILAWR